MNGLRTIPGVFSNAGKIISQTWIKPIGEATKVFRDWSDTSARDFPEQKQIIVPDPQEASRILRELSGKGQEIRRGPISGRVLNHSEKTLQWLVTRPGGTIWTNLIHQMLEDGRRDAVMRPGSCLRILGERFFNLEGECLGDTLAVMFRRPIDAKSLWFAFTPNVPGYFLSDLQISRQPQSKIGISCVIKSEEGELAAEMSRLLPQPPSPGNIWIAEGTGYNSTATPAHFKKKGIARSLYQHLLGFLYVLGVDTYRLNAGNEGLFVWPHLGFDYVRRKHFIYLLHRFMGFLMKKGVPQKLVIRAIAGMDHLWDIADYHYRGEPLGKEFLLMVGKELLSSDGIPLQFKLSPDYPGFERLYRNFVQNPFV